MVCSKCSCSFLSFQTKWSSFRHFVRSCFSSKLRSLSVATAGLGSSFKRHSQQRCFYTDTFGSKDNLSNVLIEDKTILNNRWRTKALFHIQLNLLSVSPWGLVPAKILSCSLSFISGFPVHGNSEEARATVKIGSIYSGKRTVNI
jgi:hypothetical protein